MSGAAVYGALFKVSDLEEIIQKAGTPLRDLCDRDVMLRAVAARLDEVMLFWLSRVRRPPAPAAMRKWASSVEGHAKKLLKAFEASIGPGGGFPPATLDRLRDALDDDLPEVADESLSAEQEAEIKDYRALMERACHQAFPGSAPSSKPGIKEVAQALHAVQFIALLAQRTRGLHSNKGQRREAGHILELVEAIVTAYEDLTGKSGTAVTTEAYGAEAGKRSGPALDFALAALRSMAGLIDGRPEAWRAGPDDPDPEKLKGLLLLSPDAITERFQRIRETREQRER